MLNNFLKSINWTQIAQYSQRVAKPVPFRKPRASGNTKQTFLDLKHVRTVGGNGGDGCISFLSLWCNENAGPDGGDGGHGGHVIFQADADVKDLSAIPSSALAPQGEKGGNKDCNGKSASHMILKVPIGTVIKNANGTVVGDLSKEGLLFLAAKGGAGGKGNHFFISDQNHVPKVCEYGAAGEDLEYVVEMRSMAHVGLIGFPNAGKSTLLRAMSRARPKVAEYPFTTLKPHIGMVEYDDCEQVAVADLPGLILDSHKNKGLGIQFLKHAERCMALLFVVDASLDEPWTYWETLEYELSQFDSTMKNRPRLIAANKIDLPKALEHIELMKQRTEIPIIPVSGKSGKNVDILLREIKLLYDKYKEEEEDIER